jgi:hypothetical protein
MTCRTRRGWLLRGPDEGDGLGDEFAGISWHFILT